MLAVFVLSVDAESAGVESCDVDCTAVGTLVVGAKLNDTTEGEEVLILAVGP